MCVLNILYLCNVIPTRVWDTFAEPNNKNNTGFKLTYKIRPHRALVRDLALKAG